MGIVICFFFSCKDDRTINIIGEDSSTLAAIKEVKAEFEKANNIIINVNALPYDEALEKSNFDLANGTGKYDLILQYNFALANYVKNDYIVKANDLSLKVDENDIFLNTWKEVGYYYEDVKNKNGEARFGYPFAANTMLLVYNNELFQNKEYQDKFYEKYKSKLEVPKTWDDFFKTADFFGKINNDLKGICLEGADGGWLYYEVIHYLFGMGQGVMNKQYGWQSVAKDKPLVLNSKENIDALNKYLSLKSTNYGSYHDVDMALQVKLMKEGKTAMAFMWSDIVPEMANDSRFGYALIPGDKSVIAGGAYFVNKKSKLTKEVADFIQYLYSTDVQVKMLKKGLSSPVKSVYNNPDVQSIPYLGALKQSIERSVYMMEAAEDAEVCNQAITKYVKRAWNGQMTASQALQDAHNEIENFQKQLK